MRRADLLRTSVLFLGISLAACLRPSPKSPTSESQNSSDPNASGHTSTGGHSHSQDAQSLADSIENFKLGITKDRSRATLDFMFRAGGVLRMARALRGEIGPDGKAHLKNPAEKHHFATLECLDRDCRDAAVTVTRTSGRLAGSALLRQTEYSPVRLEFFLYEMSEDYPITKMRTYFSEPRPPTQVSLTIRRIEGGHIHTFELDTEYAESGLPETHPEYYEYKNNRIQGELSPNSSIPSSIYWTASGRSALNPFSEETQLRGFTALMSSEKLKASPQEALMRISVTGGKIEIFSD